MGAHQRRWLRLQAQQTPSPRYHCRHFCSPPDPLVEDNNRKIRRRNALLKPKEKYQAELSRWELLSNTLRDLNLQTHNVEKRNLENQFVQLSKRRDEFMQNLIDEVRGSGVFGSDGEKYVKDVDDLIHFGTSGNVAGFICEAIQGVGGIVELAPGYLFVVHSTIKKVGGLFISDEV
ncbi:hypothetical protein AgCh_025235 [Apium graveolens]